MNILVCSKVSIPATDRTLPAWEYLRSLGHAVQVEHPSNFQGYPDVIISMGVTVMKETFAAIKLFPNAELFCYGWDCYDWCTDNPRKGEYNYSSYYKELLPKATEVWMASDCTGKKMQQRWGVEPWHTVKSACPWWEHDNIRDEGYILCSLREIPDRYWGRLKTTCDKLKLPLVMTEHRQTYSGYIDAVAGCRFLVSDLYELSTGGLTLMEGYYHGKPCLLADSPWHGGRDYMGDRATYFIHDDMVDFENHLQIMYANPPKLDLEECKDWVTTNYSDKRMIDDMVSRINHYTL